MPIRKEVRKEVVIATIVQVLSVVARKLLMRTITLISC